jgi:hypothetical protein
MELDGLFSGSKWQIIELISTEPKTPEEIANSLGTTVANVSQQLKLLEFAGLVKRNKIQDKRIGKPKTMLTTDGGFGYLVFSSKSVCAKTLLQFDDFQKFMCLAWTTFRDEDRTSFEDFVFKNRSVLKNIVCVETMTRSSDQVRVYLKDIPVLPKSRYGSLDFIFFKIESRKTESKKSDYPFKVIFER